MNSNEIFVRDLNLPQFFACLFVFTAFIFMTYEIVSFIFLAIKLLVKYIIYRFRKQKYKSLDFAAMRAYKLIGILKRQIKCASSEKEYYCLLNRFLGAVHMALEMGLFTYDSKILTKIYMHVPLKYENTDKKTDKEIYLYSGEPGKGMSVHFKPNGKGDL